MQAVNWQIVGVLVGMLAAFSGVVLLAVRVMLSSNQSHVDTKLTQMSVGFTVEFEKLYEGIQSNSDRWQQLEKDFLNLQIKLPEKYMQRDDWIRFSNLIDAKVDAIGAKQSQGNATLSVLLERTKTS